MTVVHDPRVLQGTREEFIRGMRLRGGSRVMKPKDSSARDSKFLQVTMRILKREKEFLEKIGRL